MFLERLQRSLQSFTLPRVSRLPHILVDREYVPSFLLGILMTRRNLPPATELIPIGASCACIDDT